MSDRMSDKASDRTAECCQVECQFVGVSLRFFLQVIPDICGLRSLCVDVTEGLNNAPKTDVSMVFVRGAVSTS